MTKDASEVLSRYYTAQRQRAIAANMSRRTARFLQSCIRIAEGHARLMNHNEVHKYTIPMQFISLDFT